MGRGMRILGWIISPWIATLVFWSTFAACIDTPLEPDPPPSRLVALWNPTSMRHATSRRARARGRSRAPISASAPCNIGGLALDVATGALSRTDLRVDARTSQSDRSRRVTPRDRCRDRAVDRRHARCSGGSARGSRPRAVSSRTIAGSIPNRSSSARSVARAARVEAIDALAEDQLVLRRVLPADELGDRDLVAVRLEHEAADHVGQVRAELAAVQRMREQRGDRRIARAARLELARDLGLAARHDRDVVGVAGDRERRARRRSRCRRRAAR